jgi:hypothetical protein
MTKRQFICPSIYCDGTKFDEMYFTPIILLLLLKNEFYGDRLMFIGDYSDTEKEVSHFRTDVNCNLYNFLNENDHIYEYNRYRMTRDAKYIIDFFSYDQEMEPVPKLNDFKEYFVVNKSKKQYISVDEEYSNKIINLLAYDKSEYNCTELATLWCNDEITLEKKIYENFVQL